MDNTTTATVSAPQGIKTIDIEAAAHAFGPGAQLFRPVFLKIKPILDTLAESSQDIASALAKNGTGVSAAAQRRAETMVPLAIAKAKASGGKVNLHDLLEIWLNGMDTTESSDDALITGDSDPSVTAPTDSVSQVGDGMLDLQEQQDLMAIAEIVGSVGRILTPLVDHFRPFLTMLAVVAQNTIDTEFELDVTAISERLRKMTPDVTTLVQMLSKERDPNSIIGIFTVIPTLWVAYDPEDGVAAKLESGDYDLDELERAAKERGDGIPPIPYLQLLTIQYSQNQALQILFGGGVDPFEKALNALENEGYRIRLKAETDPTPTEDEPNDPPSTS
jgi:hypothetical protein